MSDVGNEVKAESSDGFYRSLKKRFWGSSQHIRSLCERLIQPKSVFTRTFCNANPHAVGTDRVHARSTQAACFLNGWLMYNHGQTSPPPHENIWFDSMTQPLQTVSNVNNRIKKNKSGGLKLDMFYQKIFNSRFSERHVHKERYLSREASLLLQK